VVPEWNRGSCVKIVSALLTILAISAAHFVLTFAVFLYAMESSSIAFKDRHGNGLFLGDAAGTALQVLGQPGWTILRLYSPQSLLGEFYIFVANSVLWGCAALFLSSVHSPFVGG